MFEKKITDEQKKQMDKAAKKELRDKKKKEKKGGDGLSVVKTLVLPLLFAGIVVSAIYLVMEQKTAQEELKTTVVCMKENVAKNTFVKPDEIDKYFTVTKVDLTAVPETAYNSLSEFSKDGFYIEDTMVKSQMVLKDNIAGKDEVMDKYKDGYEVTSFNTQDFADGVNGALRKGDIVDVYALDPATEELALMASDVYVSDVYDNAGKKISEPEEIATSFTVYVTEDEVEKINMAVCYGGIQMYLKTK